MNVLTKNLKLKKNLGGGGELEGRGKGACVSEFFFTKTSILIILAGGGLT